MGRQLECSHHLSVVTLLESTLLPFSLLPIPVSPQSHPFNLPLRNVFLRNVSLRNLPRVCVPPDYPPPYWAIAGPFSSTKILRVKGTFLSSQSFCKPMFDSLNSRLQRFRSRWTQIYALPDRPLWVLQKQGRPRAVGCGECPLHPSLSSLDSGTNQSKLLQVLTHLIGPLPTSSLSAKIPFLEW